MRYTAAVLEGYSQPLAVREIEMRDPNPDQLVVRTTAVPFCSTDYLGWKGMRLRKPPVILGHTAVGVVEGIGTDVTRFAVGDRVVVAGTPECGECYYCKVGRPDQCAVLTEQSGDPVVATLPDGSDVMAGGRVGAYAQKILVQENQVWPNDSTLPDAVASLIGCGITTGLGAVFNIAKVQPGQSVAIVGLGHLGQWMVQGARLAGASQIIAIDIVDERRRIALTHGATDVIDPTISDPVKAVQDLTEGRGADVTLEAAGPEQAMQQAVAMTRKAGTVVLTGVSHHTATVTLAQALITTRGRTIHSCQNGESKLGRDIPRWLALLETGELDAAHIITKEYALSEINEAMIASGELRDLSGVITRFQ